MSDAANEIDAGLAKIGEAYRHSFASAADEQELRQTRAQLLGKQGDLTRLLKLMGAVEASERRSIGERVNAVKGAAEAAFQERLQAIHAAERQADLEAPPFDMTLPARPIGVTGHLHPLTHAEREIIGIFEALGFQPAWGPDVEFEENNFTKLAFPPDHPATDMQDTFWVKVEGGAPDARVLLRTHTSSVQVREMSSREPPMAVVCGGRAYRRDDDVTHSPMFHQVEGFMVGERVSFAHLKGVLTAFARRLYGEDVPVRFRPSYFPFVEPGAELDVGCVFCADATRSVCRICKGTGWVEVLGCGMIHPEVLRHCGIDSERFTGFAFGLGIDRAAMLKFGIPDMRLLFENDPRFLAQF